MTRPGALAGAAALFLLAATTIPSTTVAVVPSEAHALLASKASLVDAAALSNWTRATPVCDWDWVSCVKESVVELRLNELGLSGRLDTLDTVAFPALTILDLSDNNLSGTIPASISGLRSLEVLELGYNALSGPIPHQLCGLVSLSLLFLSHNQLSGELPNCLWKMEALQKMFLSDNFFSGEFPAAKSNQNCSLTILSLARNSFVGAFPLLEGCDSNRFISNRLLLSRTASLAVLDISSNRFNSSIPPELGDMRSLSDLQLYNNSLVGNIPHQLCRIHSIMILDLSNNQLIGELPDCWCNLHSLTYMDLSNNRLTGKLPNCWWNLKALEFMDLSNNSFSGKIPAAVASDNISSLRSLYLAGNGFVGAFPSVLKNCKSLTTLDMGNNMFFGVIPPWIGSQVPMLRFLSLRSNDFTGEIPPGLSQLSQLQLLDLSNNSFIGSIPIAFGNLTSMKYPKNLSIVEHLSWNKYDDKLDLIWKGNELIFKSTIQILADIDLSDNLLSQCIPKELTYLQGLRFLNLSRNYLSCRIREDIGSLSFLESLDLSSNELSGTIPSSILHLSGLSVLNVSNNLLSGKIPVGGQTQTLINPLIYYNNSGLCGFPLDTPCENILAAPDERNGEDEDHWMYYVVIAGIVSGFWLWFGMLFTVKTRDVVFSYLSMACNVSL